MNVIGRQGLSSAPHTKVRNSALVRRMYFCGLKDMRLAEFMGVFRKTDITAVLGH